MINSQLLSELKKDSSSFGATNVIIHGAHIMERSNFILHLKKIHMVF